jgi:uncharacterized protein
VSRVTWTYVIIAFAVTWSVILVSYGCYKAGMISLGSLNLVYNFGALGPLAGALIAAKVFYGRNGIKKLFSTFRLKNVAMRSVFIATSPLLFCLVGWLTYPLYAGHAYAFAETQRQYGLSDNLSYLGWILPFITYAICEEFGWRAFLLPHLQQNHTALKSTLILTIIWAAWHLPFFLWRFEFSGLITVGFFFSIFIGALIITSLFNLSKGNIALVILFHFCNNLAAALDKEYMVVVVSVGFVFLAIYLYRKYGYENLSDSGRIKNFYLAD